MNSSPLHPSLLHLASPFSRHLPGLLELNHNYLASSDGGESVHCVIPISPLDMKNAPWNQKREHYVGLTDLTGEAEFETGLRSSLSRFRCSFSPTSLYLLIPSLPLYFLLYVPNPPCFRRPSYSLWFSLRLASIFPPSEHNCSYYSSASKTACSRLKFQSYNRDIVAVPQRDGAAVCCRILPQQI